MKTFMMVVACLVLGGCGPKPGPTPSQSGQPASCLPAKATCVVSAGGVSLIRAPKFWLIDLRGSNGLDAAAVINAAKQCDGPTGCGTALGETKAKALVGELAQAQIEKLKLSGEPVAGYVIGQQRALVQIWGDRVRLEEVATQLSVGPIEGILCIPAQCVLPPPVPPRDDELR